VKSCGRWVSPSTLFIVFTGRLANHQGSADEIQEEAGLLPNPEVMSVSILFHETFVFASESEARVCRAIEPALNRPLCNLISDATRCKYEIVTVQSLMGSEVVYIMSCHKIGIIIDRHFTPIISEI
jgi:hypothetical protein